MNEHRRRCIGFPLRTECENAAEFPEGQPLWCAEHERVRQRNINKQFQRLVRGQPLAERLGRPNARR